ncbi:MAG: efflux RND transporter periplasmic adaptor subunit [Desulfocapsaceae bacterium]|nr:efflux RND transporter periplasmic adaptor subunit [Desulfocapsaceae bacterium]
MHRIYSPKAYTCCFTVVLLFVLLVVPPSIAKAPSPVIISEAKKDLFVDRVEALGTLRANESVDLTATITDTVTNIHFEDNQRVTQGDILVEMTSAEEHAMLEEMVSNLDEAEKQLNRIEPLVRQGAATQDLLDQRRRDYETAQARLKQVESRLADRLIMAPFAGVVGLRNISVGALVEPGDIITTLDDISVVKLDFAVPAIHLDTLRPGVTIEATAPAYGDRKFTGKIASLNSRIDVNTRSILARAIIPNPDGLLRPGMLMSIEMLKNPREVIVIPEEALIPEGVSNFVLIVDRDRDPVITEKREVEIGMRRPGEVEIRSGVSAGEFVVVHGAMRIRPGEPVQVIAVAGGDETLEQLLSRQGGDKQQ